MVTVVTVGQRGFCSSIVVVHLPIRHDSSTGNINEALQLSCDTLFVNFTSAAANYEGVAPANLRDHYEFDSRYVNHPHIDKPSSIVAATHDHKLCADIGSAISGHCLHALIDRLTRSLCAKLDVYIEVAERRGLPTSSCLLYGV